MITDLNQKGFTLVELSIVMIIVGLLIGGVMKGRELILNAQVASAISQIKAIDAAVTSFHDMYAAFPGDITNPVVRLAGCNAIPGCEFSGNEDDRLDRLPNGYANPGADEAAAFFIHLSISDLLTEVNPAGGVIWGGIYPKAKLYGGFHPSWTNGVEGNFVANGQNAHAGFYLTLTNVPDAAPSNSTGAISANQGQRIDSKMDDGRINAGYIRGFGTNCSAETDGELRYAESGASLYCGLHIRIQG